MTCDPFNVRYKNPDNPQDSELTTHDKTNINEVLEKYGEKLQGFSCRAGKAARGFSYRAERGTIRRQSAIIRGPSGASPSVILMPFWGQPGQLFSALQEKLRAAFLHPAKEAPGGVPPPCKRSPRRSCPDGSDYVCKPGKEYPNLIMGIMGVQYGLVQ